MTLRKLPPPSAFGYRSAIGDWTRDNLAHFDNARDHRGSLPQQQRIGGLRDFRSGRADSMTAHGIGLSIGTDVPLDLAYLDKVATIVERLQAPAYSEHLAFTRAPAAISLICCRCRRRRGRGGDHRQKSARFNRASRCHFCSRNISYLFEWPESRMTDVEFLNLVCRETGAGLLLDVENLYLNSHNHGLTRMRS